DAAMWFLIADANGLTDQALTEGQTLTIPNKVTNVHNNSATFRPYSAGEAIGDTSPTLPTAPVPYTKKGKGKCGGMGGIIVMVVTIAVTVISGGTMAPMLAAAVGNLAGQAVGMAIGVQSGFDFRSFATSVATAGIAEWAGIGTHAGTAAKSIDYGRIAADAISYNAIGQAVGNLTGAQKGFSWASVAAAGVGAAAGAYAGNKVGNALADKNNTLSRTAGTLTAASQGATASIASQLTSVALQGGRFSWSGVAVNAIGAGAGYLASGQVLPKDGGNVAPVAQAQSQQPESYWSMTANNRGTTDTPVHEERTPLPEIEVKASRLPDIREEVIANANRMLYNPIPNTAEGTVGRTVAGNVSIPYQGGKAFTEDVQARQSSTAFWTNTQRVQGSGLLIDPATGEESFAYSSAQRLQLQQSRLNKLNTKYPLMAQNNSSQGVNWYELGKSTLGVVGNSATITTGLAVDAVGLLALAMPEPSTLSKWGGIAALSAGTSLVIKGETGLVLNAKNFMNALNGVPTGQSYLPGSGLEFATQKLGGTPSQIRLAQAADMTIDLFTNPALGGMRFTTNSAAIALPALLKAPVISTIGIQAKNITPQIYETTKSVESYAAFINAGFINYELGNNDFKWW
ncbi:hypothetical protein LG198_14115, partial [Methylobacillus arboreus]|nr:hypothetical protein [Methylobacillus arboreus]